MNTSALSNDRVREYTPPRLQRRIDERIERNIRRYAYQSREYLDYRIHQLEREWDIERILQTNAAALALSGLVLGAAVNRKWFALTAGVLGFLLTHGVRGWCPPVPLLRRFGLRTQQEIDRERFALKFLRGDFDHISRHVSTGARARALSEALEL